MSSNESLQHLFKSLEESNRKTIEEANKQQTREIKKHIDYEINALRQTFEEEFKKRESEWEKKYQELKDKYNKLEKDSRKNNLIVFGVEAPKENLNRFIVEFLTKHLDIPITTHDVNDVYTIGKQSNKKPVIIKLTTYLMKQQILKNAKKLKGTNIVITEELNLEERQENKILRRNLKKARSENLNAYIRNKKLFVNGEEYSAKQLADEEEDTDKEDNIETKQTDRRRKSISVPDLTNYEKKDQNGENKEEIFVTEETEIEKKRKIAEAATHRHRLRSLKTHDQPEENPNTKKKTK